MTGVGLSMDAFAVAVCKGLGMKKIRKFETFVIALFFGGFQALMPLLGWLLGSQLQGYISSFDHWIAFILLAFIGGKMIKDSFDEENDDSEACEKLDLKELTMLAVATSIDALAVGITFAFLNVNILSAVTIIGCTTFVLSGIGVFAGNRFGAKYKNHAELIGGIVLVLIGVKILFEHLGFLAFLG
jgi:putative Mn2+ efflux pump MntP